jgi:hypothetical protein
MALAHLVIVAEIPGRGILARAHKAAWGRSDPREEALFRKAMKWDEA